MGAEYELKFRATSACQAELLAAYPDHWQTITMQTTYYDTPSGSLSAKRYTLRRRLENGVSVCTLKTPGDGMERGEWEVESDCITTAVSELCKLDVPADLAELCAEDLVSICGAAFTRFTYQLTFADFTAELALDKGLLFSGSKETPLCEVEIELKSGSRERLDAFAEVFAAEYGLVPEEKSKFARALALYKDEE